MAAAVLVLPLTVARLVAPPLGVGLIAWLAHGSSLLEAGRASGLVEPIFVEVVGLSWAPAPVLLQSLPV